MRIPFLLFLLMALSFSGVALQSQTIHAVVVADTESKQSEFAESATADFRNMKIMFKGMAEETGYPLRMYEVGGAEFVSENVKKAISLVEAQPNDIIFFYFAGKGACDPGVSAEERILHMGQEGADTISTATVAGLIKKKNARLNVVLIDACGTIWDAGVGPHKGAGAEKIYYKLLRACGTVKVYSSQCGELSYGDKKGGYFTNSSLAALDYYITNPSDPVSWKALLTKTALLTRQRAMRIFRPQSPVVFFSQDFRESCLP